MQGILQLVLSELDAKHVREIQHRVGEVGDALGLRDVHVHCRFHTRARAHL